MRFMAIVGRLAFAAFLISLAVGLVAAVGTRFHYWGYEVGYVQIFPYSLYVGLAGLALGVVWALAALFLNASTASGYGVLGLVGSLAVVALPLYNFYEVKVAKAIPNIHDVSTDTEHPPQFVALLHDRAGAVNPPDYDGPKPVKDYDGKTRSTAELQKMYYSDIKPIGLLGTTPAKLYERALSAANRMGWQIVSAAPASDGGHIEATDTTFFFGATDDIVIRVKPSGKLGARLDIRSKSRIGVCDLGANAARIRSYVKTLANS